MSGLDMPCRHCGQTARRLLLLGLMQAAGASVYPSAVKCSSNNGDDHDFDAPDAQQRQQVRA